jgi:hypothetical protein
MLRRLPGCLFLHTGWMFGEKAQAQAVILASHLHGNTTSRDFHGVDWEHRTYILEIRPGDRTPFRVETKAKVPIFSKPQQGDVVQVSYEVKNHKTEIQIEGDPRYDPALVREKRQREHAAQDAALLSGAPAATAGPRYDPGEEPRWAVPALCPACGAKVDQATAPFEESPKSGLCGQPLPCEAP